MSAKADRDHPRCRIARASAARLDCDVDGLYGSQFVEFLKAASAFLQMDRMLQFSGGPCCPPGKPNDDLPIGTLNSVLRQAGLKKQGE